MPPVGVSGDTYNDCSVRATYLLNGLHTQARIHKPLLLEEFGKIVWEKDIPKGYIEKKRNPVYDAMTGMTMDSVKECVKPGLDPCADPCLNSVTRPLLPRHCPDKASRDLDLFLATSRSREQNTANHGFYNPLHFEKIY